MRNLFSLQVETKVSVTIMIIVIIIFLVTIFKSLDSFYKFIDRINSYEEIRIEKGR